MRRSPWSARLAMTAVAVVPLLFAGVAPAVGRTAPVSGALTKSSAFLLTPPWANNVSHTVVSDYGTLKHKRTNDPLHPNDYYALDFEMKAGEKVYAAAAGTVAFAGPATGNWSTYGIVVYVVHPNGYRTLYAHLSKALVSAGRAVTTSTVIGLAGRTGGWPTVHLHFALYRGSKFTGGPYGGQAVVPEPFTPCVKTATAAGPLGLPGRCENLKRGDVLKRVPRAGGDVAPTVPGGLAVSATDPTSIRVSWNASANTVGYLLSDNLAVVTVGATSTSYTWVVTPGTYKCFHLSAFNGFGRSDWSAGWACATTPGTSTAPATPSNVAASAVSASQIGIIWTDNATTEIGYRVRRFNGIVWSTIADGLPANTTSITDSGLTPSTTYSYMVCAYNLGGESCANSVNGTTGSTWNRLNPDTSPPEHERLTCVGADSWTCVYDKLPEVKLGFNWDGTKGAFQGTTSTDPGACPAGFLRDGRDLCTEANIIRVVAGATTYFKPDGAVFTWDESLILTDGADGWAPLYMYIVPDGLACPWYASFGEALASNPSYDFDCLSLPQ